MKEGYYVIGGEYSDTTFTTVLKGTEEKHGPFDTYEEAVRKWRERTGWTIDNCMMKFNVVPTIASKEDQEANNWRDVVARLKAACK